MYGKPHLECDVGFDPSFPDELEHGTMLDVDLLYCTRHSEPLTRE